MLQVIVTLRVSVHTSGQQIMFNHPTNKTDFDEVCYVMIWYDMIRYDIPKRKQLLSSKLNLGMVVYYYYIKLDVIS